MSKTQGINESLLTAAVLTWMHDMAPQGIVVTDNALNIVSWNGWLEESSGLRAKDVVGKNLLALYPDLVERGLDKHYSDALLGQVRLLSQRFHGYLLPMPAPEFAEYPYMQQSARISPLLHEGEVIGTITVIDDVTERTIREIELQDQLEQRSRLLASEKSARQEAEDANRLKDEFLATVSHELRTPLSAIVGWASLLRSGDLDAKTFERAIESIYRNANSQTQLISDLLDVSRIISNKLTLNVSQVNLPSVIEMALDTISPEAQAKGVHLQLTMEPDFPQLSGDAERLQQIIWNLLSNAIKFTPRDGTVHVRLSLVNSEAEISVADSGIGIDSEFLPYVFDRFRQANPTATRIHGGLGLGLAIVHELVELHHGSVRVHSEGEGKGSVFIVRVPLTVSPPLDNAGSIGPAGNPGPPAPMVLAGLRILVVDDDADTRDFVRIALEQFGSEVTTAVSAAEALDALHRVHHDLIISDLGMPVEDGYSLINRVRALSPDRGGNIPAVALTAYARVDDSFRAIHSGFQIHIPKPVEPSELISAIARVVRPI